MNVDWPSLIKFLLAGGTGGILLHFFRLYLERKKNDADVMTSITMASKDVVTMLREEIQRQDAKVEMTIHKHDTQMDEVTSAYEMQIDELQGQIVSRDIRISKLESDISAASAWMRLAMAKLRSADISMSLPPIGVNDEH